MNDVFVCTCIYQLKQPSSSPGPLHKITITLETCLCVTREEIQGKPVEAAASRRGTDISAMLHSEQMFTPLFHYGSKGNFGFLNIYAKNSIGDFKTFHTRTYLFGYRLKRQRQPIL